MQLNFTELVGRGGICWTGDERTLLKITWRKWERHRSLENESVASSYSQIGARKISDDDLTQKKKTLNLFIDISK